MKQGALLKDEKDWPAAKVAMRKVADLVPFAQNSRTHSEEQVAQIAASIRQWGWTVPVLVDEDGVLIAGHARIMAAKLEGIEKVPTMTAKGWSDEQKRAYVIADNKLAMNAGWDDELLRAELSALAEIEFDLAPIGFSDSELVDLGVLADPELPSAGGGGSGSIRDRFMIAPFSVLNAREGWWQDRKRAWIDLGIKSELGRGENGHHAAPGGSPMVAGYDASGKRLTGIKNVGKGADGDGEPSTGTSIFDPVLAELSYRWFSPPGGLILDPFAGGSVRGIVAAQIGRQYVGVELRPEQVEANRAQGEAICDEIAPVWINGDSRNIAELTAGAEADMIFSCPPYADLEVYSDDPADLSTLDYADFLEAYRAIIAESCALLKEDRFAAFVVGEVRDKRGAYIDFVGDTVQAFRDAGLAYYNEAILVTSVGSLPIRIAKQFTSSRKMGKTHQNVLIFCKGDGKRAAEACGEVETGDIGAEDHSDLGEEL